MNKILTGVTFAYEVYSKIEPLFSAAQYLHSWLT